MVKNPIFHERTKQIGMDRIGFSGVNQVRILSFNRSVNRYSQKTTIKDAFKKHMTPMGS